MAELDTADRKKIDKRQFAYVDAKGTGHLPIHDERHIRNAMARWNQADFPSKTAKESARRKILAAARRHRIDVSKDDKVAKSRAT
jgi:aspartyl/asparaginyl beta-hydroxylase (cupin superfamily)